MKPQPKYKTYAELAAAFKSGEIDPNYVLILDKGGTENHLSYHKKGATDEEIDRKYEEGKKLFCGWDQPIEGVFEAAGIPCEWC